MPIAETTIVGGQTADVDDWPAIAFLLAAWDSNDDGSTRSPSVAFRMVR